MFRYQYFDEDGDVCEQECRDEQELNFFINTIPLQNRIGILTDREQLEIEMEARLLMMQFPKNKVN